MKRRRSSLMGPLLAGASLPLAAADVPSMDSAANLGRTMLGLGVVIALVFALAWVARRVQSIRAMSGSSGGPIQIVGQLALGTRERLLLVEVDGRRVLLGVVPGSITRLDGSDAPPAEENFASRLSSAQRAATRGRDS